MPVYMNADNLGQPVALSFHTTANDGRLALDVQRLAALWGKPAGESRVSRDDWLRAWRNIGVLASRLFDTLDPQGRCDPETFHHLLLAVGNFKRQAGDILFNGEMDIPSTFVKLPTAVGVMEDLGSIVLEGQVCSKSGSPVRRYSARRAASRRG